MPLKSRTRVCFSSRGNIAVANDTAVTHATVLSKQGIAYRCEGLVLDLSVGVIVGSLQLNTDTEVITVVPPAIAGAARMPCPLAQINKLHYLTAATDQQVGGNLGTADFVEKRMFIPVQTVGKQALNTVSPIFSRWQRNIVYYQ